MFRNAKGILLLFFVFNGAVAAPALSSDLRLIQMVPPESQIIASMLRPNPEGKPSNFLLITVSNRIDFEDFHAVTGADASRLIHQVVFVAAVGGDGTLSEHSLLVSGHFNRDVIFRFSESGRREWTVIAANLFSLCHPSRASATVSPNCAGWPY